MAASETSGHGFWITSVAWDFEALRLYVTAQTDILAGKPVGGAVRNPNSGAFLGQQPLRAS